MTFLELKIGDNFNHTYDGEDTKFIKIKIVAESESNLTSNAVCIDGESSYRGELFWFDGDDLVFTRG